MSKAVVVVGGELDSDAGIGSGDGGKKLGRAGKAVFAKKEKKKKKKQKEEQKETKLAFYIEIAKIKIFRQKKMSPHKRDLCVNCRGPRASPTTQSTISMDLEVIYLL